jgi:hypothetical protein
METELAFILDAYASSAVVAAGTTYPMEKQPGIIRQSLSAL